MASTSDPADNAGHDPYAAFRSSNFRLFVAGFGFGTIGFQMQAAAAVWEIYQWTGSKMALGWIGAALAIPTALLSLPAGHIADRFNRKTVTAITLVFTGIFAAMLGCVSIMHDRGTISVRTAELSMYGILMLTGTAGTMGRPARSALLPQIVKPEIFANAITWNSSIFELSAILGPALGGLAVAWFASAAYFINAILCLVYMAFILMLRVDQPAQESRRAAGWSDVVAGVEFVWKTKKMLGIMTLDLFAVLFGGATYLLPVFAKDILGMSEVGHGWLRSAPGIGAVSMAFFLAHRPPMKHAGRALLLAVAGFGIATVAFGLSHNFWLSMLMLYITGACDNISVVVRHTLIQALTPNSMRGRVSAVNQIFIGSSNELGGMESGMTAHWLGPVVSVVGGGIGTIIVVIASALTWPEIRGIGSLVDIKPVEVDVDDPLMSEMNVSGESTKEGST